MFSTITKILIFTLFLYILTTEAKRNGCRKGYIFTNGECVRTVAHNPDVSPQRTCKSAPRGVLADGRLLYTAHMWRPENIYIFEISHNNLGQTCDDCGHENTILKPNIAEFNLDKKCWCNKRYEDVTSGLVLCKQNTTSKNLPRINGNPCVRSISGYRTSGGRNVYFDTEYITEFKRDENKWRPGNYNCKWSFYGWNQNPDRFDVTVRLFVVFEYKKIQKEQNDTGCHLHMLIRDNSDQNVIRQPECIDARTYRTILISSTSGDISVDIDINNKNQNAVSFSFIATHVETRKGGNDTALEPLSYYVNETSLPLDYTWQMARNFCRSEFPNGDLCSLKRLCSDHTSIKSMSNSSGVRYIPISDNYNEWTSVNTPAACTHMFYKSPPTWGTRQGECIDRNCNFKNLLYCCHYESPPQLPTPSMVSIRQHSSKLSNGEYVYKYSSLAMKLLEADYVMKTKFNNYEGWLDIGRIFGDYWKFQLQDVYSEEMPDPIYFCYMDDEEGDVTGKNRFYLMSSLPCTKSWISDFALYGSLAPRDGLTPIYVGVSTQGSFLRSRVSSSPFCCGFDDPGVSFVIYTRGNNFKPAVIPPYGLCLDEKEFTEKEGVVNSPNFPVEYPNNIDCTWTIRVKEGRVIQVHFTDLEVGVFEPPCMTVNDYIEFTNPTSKRTFGRVCGLEQNKPLPFESDSNVLKIRFSASHLSFQKGFRFTYMTVAPGTDGPTKYVVPNNATTWENAKDICKSKNTELCRLNEICPLYSDGIFIPETGTAYIAVQDEHNGWVESKHNRACSFYNTLNGPPKFMSNITTDPNEFRENVFCCSYNDVTGRSLLDVNPFANMIMVYVTHMADEYGNPLYRFALTDDNPTYSVYYGADYHGYGDYDNGGGVFENKTWESVESGNEGDILGFLASSASKPGEYEHAIYFCSQEDVMTGIKRYMIEEDQCRQYWSLEFISYVSKTQNSEDSLTKITVQKSEFQSASRISASSDGCCGYHENVFDFYVFSVLS